MSNYHSDSARRLFTVITSIETPEECCSFFEDLCTIKEVQAMCQRLEIAKALSDGASYADAMEKTGASSATVGRVNRCLNYGDGGYSMIIERLAENE